VNRVRSPETHAIGACAALSEPIYSFLACLPHSGRPMALPLSHDAGAGLVSARSHVFTHKTTVLRVGEIPTDPPILEVPLVAQSSNDVPQVLVAPRPVSPPVLWATLRPGTLR